jgi:hypothetical protein
MYRTRSFIEMLLGQGVIASDNSAYTEQAITILGAYCETTSGPKD